MKLRLFVALDVSEEILSRLAEYSRQLQQRERAARWVRSEAMHLTLKFIGEAAPGLTEQIRGALGAVRLAAAPELRFRGTGFFPNERRPRVFFVAIEANVELGELAEKVELALEPLGIPREQRSFHPHLTLARLERPSAALRRAAVEAGAREFGRTVEREFHLYRSELDPAGARYTRLASYPLGSDRR